MSVKKVDPVTNDLVRGSSFERVEGAQEIAQGVDGRLKKLAGEDPWDLDDGTRWLELILVRGVPESLILGELQRRIMSQPGMLTVETIEASRTPGTDSGITVPWTGTASVDQLNQVQQLQGQAEITTGV